MAERRKAARSIILAIRVFTNVPALLAQRELSRHTSALGRTAERLSSGLRINRASDDAAGLFIAETLRADTAVLGQAIRNANDGISLINIADGSLGEITDILQRMLELSIMAANSIHTPKSRSSFQTEFDALAGEITRIARTTKFNNILLLSATSPRSFPVTLQVGTDGKTSSHIILSGVQGTLEALNLAGADEKISYSLNAATALEGQAASRTAAVAVRAALDEALSARGMLGASESRLTASLSQLESQRVSIQDAESRIGSADVAQEAAEYVRLNILRDAAAAVLVQANQQPQIVLRLLET